jgi:large subunit ribosomal protein L10
MPKKLNALLKKELGKKLDGVPNGVLVDYQGLPSDETYALRKELRTKKIKMLVLKNSIATLAMKELGTKGTETLPKGPMAICFNDDPVVVAGTLVEYKRKNKKTKLEIKGGLLDRQVIPAAEVARLAALPGRQQLLGMVVGTLAAPMQGMVQATAGILRKVLYALNAVKDKREKEGGAAAPAAG